MNQDNDTRILILAHTYTVAFMCRFVDAAINRCATPYQRSLTIEEVA